MSTMRPILIAGPTASGKSGLAVRLPSAAAASSSMPTPCRSTASSRILTARPKAQDEARVPHALYGFVSGHEAYSAGRYAADAVRALDEARGKGLRPIIVGGTGLYFKTLLEGLSPMPHVGEDVRAHWRTEAAKAGPGALHDALARRDPQMAARLAPGDTPADRARARGARCLRRIASRVAAPPARAGARCGGQGARRRGARARRAPPAHRCTLCGDDGRGRPRKSGASRRLGARPCAAGHGGVGRAPVAAPSSRRARRARPRFVPRRPRRGSTPNGR